MSDAYVARNTTRYSVLGLGTLVPGDSCSPEKEQKQPGPGDSPTARPQLRGQTTWRLTRSGYRAVSIPESLLVSGCVEVSTAEVLGIGKVLLRTKVP